MKLLSGWMGLCLLGSFTACATTKAEQTQLSLSMPSTQRVKSEVPRYSKASDSNLQISKFHPTFRGGGSAFSGGVSSNPREKVGRSGEEGQAQKPRLASPREAQLGKQLLSAPTPSVS